MDLGARSMSALRWGAGVKIVGQIIAWAMTILVIRVLSPEDYGLMALATIFISFLTLLNEMGMRTVLIHKPDLNDLLIRQIAGIIVLLNLFLCVLMFFSAEYIAAFFSESRLEWIIKALSAYFIIACFDIVPTSFLIKDLRLKEKEITYVGASLVGGLVTLAMAYKGFGVWSIVIGNLLHAVLNAVVVNVLVGKYWFPRFNFKNMHGILSYGGLVTLDRAMWSLYTQADIFIIGKTIGKELLGYYSVAMHLSSLIMHKTGAMLYNVVLPTVSQANELSYSVSYIFLKAVRIMSFFVFPMFLGMSLVSKDFIAVLLGDKWEISASLLMILSLVMPFRMLSNLFPPALQGVGNPKCSTINVLITFIIMPSAFLIGIQWGLIGVSIAWAIAFPIAFCIMVYRSKDVLGITIQEFIKALAIPVLCSIIMYILLYVLNKSLFMNVTPFARMILDILIALLMYAVFMRTLLINQTTEVIQAFRK